MIEPSTAFVDRSRRVVAVRIHGEWFSKPKMKGSSAMGIDIKNITDYNEQFKDFDFSEVILRRENTEYQFKRLHGPHACEHLNDEAERLFSDSDECGQPASWSMVDSADWNSTNPFPSVDMLCPAHVLTELGQRGGDVVRGEVKLAKSDNKCVRCGATYDGNGWEGHCGPCTDRLSKMWFI